MIYFFDQDNKYIGCREQESGELLPESATNVKPVDIGETQYPVWNGETWDVVERPVEEVVEQPPAPPSMGDRMTTVEDIVTLLAEVIAL